MIKKKVMKKGPKAATTPVSPVKAPVQAPVLLKPGKYAEPVPTLPLGTKDGHLVLRKGLEYPSGVSGARKIAAFVAVLYVDGKLLTMRVKDLYIALMNEVKDYCN